MALITCPACRGKLSSTARKCPHCGHEPGREQTTCPECGTKVAKSEFCPECGYPLKGSPPGPSPGRTTRPCPHCDRSVPADAAVCPLCKEAIAGLVVSYCTRCRDEYIVKEAEVTFKCPRCGQECDIAEGIRILKDIEARRAQQRTRRRFLRSP